MKCSKLHSLIKPDFYSPIVQENIQNPTFTNLFLYKIYFIKLTTRYYHLLKKILKFFCAKVYNTIAYNEFPNTNIYEACSKSNSDFFNFVGGISSIGEIVVLVSMSKKYPSMFTHI